jgi:8-oxo-dGTP diphosphatase
MIQQRIHVACAIIEKDGLILATRRSADGPMPGKWEFPGGKIKPREEPEECVHREIREELGLHIQILRPLPPYFHEYKDFEIVLYPFICALAAPGKGISGKAASGKGAGGKTPTSAAGPTLRDHSEARWDLPENLTGLDWAEADVPILEAYIGLKRARPGTRGAQAAPGDPL